MVDDQDLLWHLLMLQLQPKLRLERLENIGMQRVPDIIAAAEPALVLSSVGQVDVVFPLQPRRIYNERFPSCD